MTSKQYTKTLINLARLYQEIEASAVTIAIDKTLTYALGTLLNLAFKADLSDAEWAIADAIVEAHKGEPLPSGQTDANGNPIVTISSTPVNSDLGDTAAKSTGQSYPVPVATQIQADYNERTRLTTDYYGLLQTRGPVFTDESSFRDDFPSTGILHTLTGTLTFTKGSTTVTGNGCSFTSELFIDSHIHHVDDPDTCFVQVKTVTGVNELQLWDPYQGDHTVGSAIHARWVPLVTNDGEVGNETSCIKLTSGTTVGTTYVMRSMDFLPIKIAGSLKISRRDGNTDFRFGVADNHEAPNVCAGFIFSGGVNTQVTCRSQSSQDADNTQTTVVSLPNGQTTDLFNSYSLNVKNDAVMFYINDILVAQHKKHIPGPYDELNIYLCNNTLAPVQTPVVVWIDYVNLINHDEVVVADPYLEPKEIDGRVVIHATPRRLGTYTYFTSGDDRHDDPTVYGGSTNTQEMHLHHLATDPLSQQMYVDFNTIENDTHIHEAAVQILGARNDVVSLEMVPKVTAVTTGSNTFYNLYGGYLVVPAAGNGITALTEAPKLVQCVANEYGVKPAGYWNADWDHATKSFINIAAAPNGDGNYNIFAAEVVLGRFGNRLRLLGDGERTYRTDDITQIGHGMRTRITIETTEPNHEWWWCGTIHFFRKKTS